MKVESTLKDRDGEKIENQSRNSDTPKLILDKQKILRTLMLVFLSLGHFMLDFSHPRL